MKKFIIGENPEYSERRGQHRYQYGGKDRRSGRDRRTTWPGRGKNARGTKHPIFDAEASR
jgi:hypothetical protein